MGCASSSEKGGGKEPIYIGEQSGIVWLNINGQLREFPSTDLYKRLTGKEYADITKDDAKEWTDPDSVEYGDKITNSVRLIKVEGKDEVYIVLNYTERMYLRPISKSVIDAYKFDEAEFTEASNDDFGKYGKWYDRYYYGTYLELPKEKGTSSDFPYLYNHNGTVYINIDDELRGIPTPQVFKDYFGEKNPLDVSKYTQIEGDLKDFKLGVGDNLCDEGIFWCKGDKEGEKDYYIVDKTEAGQAKHWIPQDAWKKLGFSGDNIETVSQAEADKIQDGVDIEVKDGLLVGRQNDCAYLKLNGYLREIDDLEVIKKLYNKTYYELEESQYKDFDDREAPEGTVLYAPLTDAVKIVKVETKEEGKEQPKVDHYLILNWVDKKFMRPVDKAFVDAHKFDEKNFAKAEAKEFDNYGDKESLFSEGLKLENKEKGDNANYPYLFNHGGDVYLLIDGELRHITNPDHFAKYYGDKVPLNPADFNQIEQGKLDDFKYSVGDPLPNEPIYQITDEKGAVEYYFIDQTLKGTYYHHVTADRLKELKLNGTPETWTQADLNGYSDGGDL